MSCLEGKRWLDSWKSLDYTLDCSIQYSYLSVTFARCFYFSQGKIYTAYALSN